MTKAVEMDSAKMVPRFRHIPFGKDSHNMKGLYIHLHGKHLVCLEVGLPVEGALVIQNLTLTMANSTIVVLPFSLEALN
jgi:hypothetical protein